MRAPQGHPGQVIQVITLDQPDRSRKVLVVNRDGTVVICLRLAIAPDGQHAFTASTHHLHPAPLGSLCGSELSGTRAQRSVSERGYMGRKTR